jgi:hypothetical protein
MVTLTPLREKLWHNGATTLYRDGDGQVYASSWCDFGRGPSQTFVWDIAAEDYARFLNPTLRGLRALLTRPVLDQFMLSDLLARLDADPSPLFALPECPQMPVPSPGPFPWAAQTWMNVGWQDHRVKGDFAPATSLVDHRLRLGARPVRFRSTDQLVLELLDRTAPKGSERRLRSATYDIPTQTLSPAPYRLTRRVGHFRHGRRRSKTLRNGCTVAVSSDDRTLTVTHTGVVIYRYTVHPAATLGTLWTGPGRRVGLLYRMRDYLGGDSDTVLTWDVSPDRVTPGAYHTAAYLGDASLGPAARLAYVVTDPDDSQCSILRVVSVS